MFLGLIVLATLALTAGILAMRAVRSLFRRLTGREPGHERRRDRKTEPPTEPERKVGAKAESKSRSETPAPEPDPEEELTMRRHSDARDRGITEAFAPEGKLIGIDPKAVADMCVKDSNLTYLEFGNRELAGEDFFGFNLLVDKDSRMVLTYNGQAVASVTAVETKATIMINGREEEGTAPGMRINTFPPTVSPGLLPSDVGRMLSAAERVRACGDDPALVADCMVREFTSPENVRRLKIAIDPKIQTRMSGSPRKIQTKKPARKTQAG